MLAQEIVAIFWRKLTPVDFFNIERASTAGPTSGGGQLYIDVPLGRGVSPDEFGEFFNRTPLGEQSSEWQPIEIDVHSGFSPEVVARLGLAPRKGGNGRYRIANQNRQRQNSARHPAWSTEHGFPAAPNDISSKSDPRMPNLDYLKVCIGRTELRQYYAFYTNSADVPSLWPKGIGLEILFGRNDEVAADGILGINGGFHVRDIAALREASITGTEQTSTESSGSATVVRRSLIREYGGARPSTEQSEVRRDASDISEAISVRVPRAREAEDWAENRLRGQYGHHTLVRYGHTNLESIPLSDGLLPGADFSLLEPYDEKTMMYVEVKSSEGSLPRSVRLTAAELRRAKRCAEEGTPYEIWIVVFEGEIANVTRIDNFEQIASTLTIDDLVSVEVEVRPLD